MNVGIWWRVLKIFILGPYRSVDRSRRDMALLEQVRHHLRNFGWDARLAVDEMDMQDPPFKKTMRIASRTDAQFFVFTSTDRLEGVASELTALQITHPRHASRRVAFVEETLQLSAILDHKQSGVLATPPIAVVPFAHKDDLVASMTNYAKLIDAYGGVRRNKGGR